tara:strand:+ start:585 stop:3098 length:2514 start_codon:yes stop_codon:yes gene_type:complete
METITNISLNFTNGGGGHSAQVNTVLNAQNVQNGETIGSVIGEAGETSAFSNEKISEMLQNFVCVSKTKSANATSKGVSRKYVDKTTLALQSIVVLLRGQNCSPREDLEFESEVPYFSEVSNAPIIRDSQGRDFPFPSLDPIRKESLIIAGRIYNYESAAMFNGVKISLVYNDGKLKEDFCLNVDEVSDLYKAAPDLSQYDLKYGYTFNEFLKIIELAGLKIRNVPIGETQEQEDIRKKILFESSGTLHSVVSSVCSYLGYYWYIDPKNGEIVMLSSEEAVSMEIPDHTETTDENIINASFTDNAQMSKLVNVYTGTTDKPEDKSPKDDDRPKPIFFKRYRIDTEQEFKDLKMNQTTLGAFFALFNQGASTEVFDMYLFWLLSVLKRDLKIGKIKQVFGENIELGELYKKGKDAGNDTLLPFNNQIWNWGPRKGIAGNPCIFASALANKEELAAGTKLTDKNGNDLNRADNKFQYILCNSSIRKPLPKGSTTDLFPFLRAYFAIAGGIYISNGYGEYKADRMEFQNANNITVLGPFKGTTKIKDIKDLSDVYDILDILKIGGKTVEDIANATKGDAKSITVNKNFFIAIRNIKKLERFNGELLPNMADLSIFKNLEFFENARKPKKLWMGGNEGVILETGALKNIFNQSIANFKAAVEFPQGDKNGKSLRLEYIRRKTRVNKKPEDGEEKEDDELAGGTESQNKMSELFDRFDFKYFSVVAPEYDRLNKLSLSSLSGSTVEMKALKQVREKYSDVSESPKSSSRTLYGLHIPEFKPTMNSININVTSQGIQTTISESTFTLIPPDQNILSNTASEISLNNGNFASFLSAGQKNYFKI